MHLHTTLVFLLISDWAFGASLTDLYERMNTKKDNVRERLLVNFIEKHVPSGIDKPQPALAEYETFHQDRRANFITNPDGKVIFRQYRRLLLSNVLGGSIVHSQGTQKTAT